MKTLKSIMTRGTLIVFSTGVLAFIIYTLLDILVQFWKPAIVSLTGREYLAVPLTIVFTILIIALVGFIFSQKRLFDRFSGLTARIPIINWFLGERRIPQSIHDMPGALVKFSDGSYYIAALVGNQKFKNRNGELEEMYKLYCPSAPVPWSGLPIIFAEQSAPEIMEEWIPEDNEE
jgi:uncharacterized membrane protein